MTDLRVGVIGIGWAGQQHLAAYHALDGVRRSSRAAGRWGEHDGTGAVELAHVVDACYRSAAAQREIRLADRARDAGAEPG